MTAKFSPLAVVVKREMKQSRLEQFIAEHLANQTAAHQTAARREQPQRRTIRLLARSLESPVVKALIASGPTLAEAEINVEVIVAMPSDAARADPVLDGLPFSMALRRATTPRLLDAHEQLLLGPVTTWVGDSMRRDPAQRDAYETFAEACETTAEFARKAFERLRVHSEAVQPAAVIPAVSGDAALVASLAGIGEGPRPSGPMAGTRH